jgi:hypothetical protein
METSATITLLATTLGAAEKIARFWLDGIGGFCGAVTLNFQNVPLHFAPLIFSWACEAQPEMIGLSSKRARCRYRHMPGLD